MINYNGIDLVVKKPHSSIQVLLNEIVIVNSDFFAISVAILTQGHFMISCCNKYERKYINYLSKNIST